MQKFFILGSALIVGMGGLLSFALETDASYTESERQHIKRFIGDDYAKLITGHYPVHSAEFHYRELDRTTFLLDKNPRGRGQPASGRVRQIGDHLDRHAQGR